MNFKTENDIGVEVYTSGTIRWYQYGKTHREDAPAVTYYNGMRFWRKNGKLHREDGPAIERSYGDKTFFLEGKWYDEKDYWERINEF